MKFTGLLLLAFFSFASASAQEPPNILLIIADDLGVDRLNGYHDGNLMAITPTLDSLRAAGITFTNAAASPVCSPTRAAIMTGKYGVKNGVLGVPGNLVDTDESVFDELAARTGNAYADALIGKWHLSRRASNDVPLTFGPDTYDGYLNGAPTDYYDWARIQDGASVQSTEYVTTALSRAAGEWIAEQSNPWFLWLAHAAPHSPYHVPPAGTYSVGNPTNNIRQYVAMVEALDYETGRLLAGLTPEVRENTLVIFVGDNGTPGNVMQDYPTGHGKGSVYQGGVRIPLIVAGKGVERAGEREDALVHVTDLHATILEAAGAELPGGRFNSLSFYPLLGANHEEAESRTYNYVEVENANGGSGWAIRNAQYKLLRFEDGREEMYDLLVDSFEVNNLLAGTLTAEQLVAEADLEAEASVIRTGWSCRDLIQNGDETGIDCGTMDCGACTTSAGEPAVAVDLLLYPNPTTDFFVVDALGERIESVRVFTAGGQLLRQEEGHGMRLLEVSVTGLKRGLLLAEVRTVDGGSRVLKVVRR